MGGKAIEVKTDKQKQINTKAFTTKRLFGKKS
jgi:hypothetical protein